MTDPIPPSTKGQLQAEAARWFVVMRGPAAEEQRAEFEEWLKMGAMHRSAYDRIARIYEMGKQVDWANLPRPRPIRGTLYRFRFAILAALAILGLVIWRISYAAVAEPEHSTTIFRSRVTLAAPSPCTLAVNPVDDFKGRQTRTGSTSMSEGDTDFRSRHSKEQKASPYLNPAIVAKKLSWLWPKGTIRISLGYNPTIILL